MSESDDRIRREEIGEVPLGNNVVETHKIVAVRRDSREITAYKLEDGTVIDKATAVQMCEAGQLPDYKVGVSRDDELYIRGVGDGDESNNLRNMPGF